MNDLMKASIAEFVGTFALIFLGAGVVAAAGANGWDAVAPALAHGLIILGMAFAFGHLSGGNFNPAVTLGLLVGGKMKIERAVYYWVAQFAGAIIAAIILRGVLPPGWGLGETTGALTATAPWSAALIEGIITFIFVSVIFQTAAHNKAGNLAPIAIGLTLAACIAAFGATTGASLNPARTLGPSIVAGNTDYLIAYLIGIFGGGALAGAFGAYVMIPNVDPAPIPPKPNSAARNRKK